MRHPTRLIAAAIAALMLPALGACGSSSGNSASGGDSFKIGLLLPETTTARYETKDKPYFEAKLKESFDVVIVDSAPLHRSIPGYRPAIRHR